MVQTEIKDWNELLLWVEKNIFQYDDNQHLKKEAVLRLRGIQTGKAMANNKIKDNGYYPFEIILLTFKAYKGKILNAVKEKKFDSEGNKMAYICAIVNSHINEIYERKKNADKVKKSIDKIDMAIATYEGMQYKYENSSSRLIDNAICTEEKYKDLW